MVYCSVLISEGLCTVIMEVMMIGTDLPTHPYFTTLVRKSVSSMDVQAYFSKYGQRVSRKYGNCDVNKCQFVFSEVNR